MIDRKRQTNGPMKLVLCECGRVYVTCGTVTLHFDRDEFLVLAGSMNQLAAIIKQRPAHPGGAARPDAQTQICH